MKLVRAPEALPPRLQAPNTLFLAGGISGCRDWQSDMVEMLSDLDITIFNPRRTDFDLEDKSMTIEQIHWEGHALHIAEVISFWFSPETLCPITLFELGKHLAYQEKRLAMTGLPGMHVLVGCHPDYARKLDVEEQVQMMVPETKIVYTLDELAAQVREVF